MKNNIVDIINEEIVAIENQDKILNEILDNLEGLDDSSPNLPLYGDHLNSINETNKTIMPKVKETDANKLIDWWNANTKFYHFKIKRNDGYWDVVRQLT